MKLFLFDIDGTILRTNGLGRRAVRYALEATTGRALDLDPISFSGKTDPQIFREILAHHGVPDNEADAMMPALLARYTEKMQETITESTVTLIPGVAPLLDTLAARGDVALALLTGNVEPMAFLKLERVGLAHHFDFGAFGSDSAHRPDLPAIATARAQARAGRPFTGHDVVIIGDTEHDIACGRGIDAYAVAVCTGHFDRAALEPHGPHLLLESLEDPAPLLGLLS